MKAFDVHGPCAPHIFIIVMTAPVPSFATIAEKVLSRVVPRCFGGTSLMRARFGKWLSGLLRDQDSDWLFMPPDLKLRHQTRGIIHWHPTSLTRAEFTIREWLASCLEEHRETLVGQEVIRRRRAERASRRRLSRKGMKRPERSANAKASAVSNTVLHRGGADRKARTAVRCPESDEDFDDGDHSQ
jgi:hypothetical protein